MTRRYGHPIAVTRAGNLLTGFQWKGIAYRVVEVLATWHLRDRWWETGKAGEPGTGTTGEAEEAGGMSLPSAVRQPPSASDRHYYRVRCASGLICEVYHDVVSDAWVLDSVYD